MAVPEVFENHLAPPASSKHLRIDHYQSSGQDDGIQDESIQGEDVLVKSDTDWLFHPDRENHQNWCTVAIKNCVQKWKYGEREYQCQKSGKEKVKNGNIYLHFVTGRLAKYD